MPVRLMIVDDHESVRELLRAIVAKAPEDVVISGEAEDAEEALATIDRVDPDVVVLDARMPFVGGLEAAPMILERRPGQKILLFSALLDADVCDRAERAGIAACVSKTDLDAIPRVAFELALAQLELAHALAALGGALLAEGHRLAARAGRAPAAATP